MKEVVVDPVILIGTLFTIIGAGVAWLFVRLDHTIEDIRKDMLDMEKSIGALQNADQSCTRDQDLLKKDMSKIRSAILKLVASKRLARRLRRGE